MADSETDKDLEVKIRLKIAKDETLSEEARTSVVLSVIRNNPPIWAILAISKDSGFSEEIRDVAIDTVRSRIMRDTELGLDKWLNRLSKDQELPEEIRAFALEKRPVALHNCISACITEGAYLTLLDIIHDDTLPAEERRYARDGFNTAAKAWVKKCADTPVKLFDMAKDSRFSQEVREDAVTALTEFIKGFEIDISSLNQAPNAINPVDRAERKIYQDFQTATNPEALRNAGSSDLEKAVEDFFNAFISFPTLISRFGDSALAKFFHDDTVSEKRKGIAAKKMIELCDDECRRCIGPPHNPDRDRMLRVLFLSIASCEDFPKTLRSATFALLEEGRTRREMTMRMVSSSAKIPLMEGPIRREKRLKSARR
jgi:hypothetical protein